MARQDINIGVEGNDGTGDSIRESFRKVNENFSEIYAIFGAGGSIAFTALSDTPDTLLPNTIPLVNDAGSQIQLVELASNSALDATANDTITFSYSVGGKLVISSAFTKLYDDEEPKLRQPLYGGLNPIGGIAEPSQDAADALNTIHNTNLTEDDLVITKGFADRRYVSSGLPIRIANEPVNQDDYVLTVNRYLSSNVEVLNHGYDTGINGTAFVFKSVYTDPNDLTTEVGTNEVVAGRSYKIVSVGTTDWTAVGAQYNKVGEVFKATTSASGSGRVNPVYFLRYVDENTLAVFSNKTAASYVSDADAYANGAGWIEISPFTIADDDTHTFTDASVDVTLEGNYLSDVAMPRKSIVRRQGDTMEGPLTLSDHPGDLSGFGTPNGADDLQAATKYYVDSSAYASTQNLYVSTDGDDRMIGVPPGKEGSSLQYAFRTVNAAARRADEIIRTSAPEPGPYFQTVTKDNGDAFAEVTRADVVSPVYEQTRYLLEQNRDFLTKEISGYLKWKYPNFVYNIDLCERDTGLIIDAMAFDINRGLSANSLTRTAAERYYSSTSGRYAITQQLTETVDSIETLKGMVDAILNDNLYREKSIDAVTRSGTSNERARVTTTTNHNLTDGEQVIFKDMGGMVEIELQTAYVKNIPQPGLPTDGKVFELYTDPYLLELWDISAYTNYTTGGRMGVVYQPRVETYNGIKETGFIYNDVGVYDPANATNVAAASALTGTNGKFDLIVNIITNGIDAGGDTVYGSNYKIVLDNGSTNNYVDQANPDNTDTLPGKIMVGKISGAQGRIVKVTQNDGTEGSDKDSFELVQLNGKDFVVGEAVEFGNFVKEKQVAILIESGIYEEDYPIRLNANISVVGDEFRRVIIRPKRRVSQSPWADMYFFRDREFDDIPLVDKGAPFYNQTGELQGYFGRYYLTDPERPLNVGPSVTNAGNYDLAADVLRLNKEFIQNEVLHYIDANAQDLLYNKVTCQRDIGLMLDAVRYDAAIGTNYNTVTAGLAYRRANNAYNLNYEQAYTVAAINETKAEVAVLTDVAADGTALNRANAGFDEIIDIIENNTPDALTFPAPSSLPTTDADDAAVRLQANRTFIQKEIIAWITQNYPFFDYSQSPCERDVGYIVDALTYDILYGGNSASQTAAKSYFDGTRSNLGVGESEVTLASYARLKTVVDEVVRGVTVTVSLGNDEVQDTSGNSAGTTEGNQLQTLLEDNIIRVIDDNSISNLDPTSYPNLAWVSATTRAASDEIFASKATITSSVIAYLDNEIAGNFIYDTAKCARDVGLIIDSVSLDLERGGSEFTLEAQGEYYSNYILQFDASPGTDANFGGQATITSAAISHISTLAGDLLTGVAPTANTSVLGDISLGDVKTQILNDKGINVVSTMGNLVDTITFAFDPAYNPPKRNDDDGVDVFLMGDATRVQNCTVQGHGGFMVVLDPEGQVLTKSPYIQVGSSFSKSDNRKAFRGGMYVDAYVGNIPAYVPQTINTGAYNGSGKVNNFELWIQSEQGQGLFVREPQLPCPFYVEGRRYQVNAISDYDSGNGWCKIYLDSRSNDGAGYDETQFADGLYYRNLFLQTAGNRSMLGNDFTQINDLGYGLVTNNGALSEMVSMFTYYCQVAYYSKNGSEIRSTNGSNGYGHFGLVAEGADPNEIPDEVTLADPMCFPAQAYTSVDTPNALDDTSLYVTNMPFKPTPNSLITIDHGGATGVLNYVISSVQNASDTDNDGTDGNSVDDIVATGNNYSNRVYKLELRADDASATDFFGSLRATVADGTLIEYRNNFTQTFDGVKSPQDLDYRPSTAINFDESDSKTYRSLSFAQADAFSQPLRSDEILAGMELGYEFVSPEVDTANLGGGYGSSIGDTKIAVKNIGITPEVATRLTRDRTGNQPPVTNECPDAHSLIQRNIRFVQEEVLAWINATYPALSYDTQVCYRDLGYIVSAVAKDLLFNGNANTVYAAKEYYQVGTLALPGAQVAETVAAIDKAKEIVNDYILTQTAWSAINTNGVTQDLTGNAAEPTASRNTTLFDIVTDVIQNGLGVAPVVTGYTGGMIFTWQGKTHQVVKYDDTGAFPYIEIVDNGVSIGSYAGGGVSTAVTASDRVIPLGLDKGATAEITLAISLCRATGHDFTQIGSGGYNTTNYPNVLYGPPTAGDLSDIDFWTDAPTASDAQVWERRKGRVFWMSTDQNGFFRVGKFFSVDQGTGDIAFSGEIGLTGANSLGFKRGVTINEFSADDSFSDFSGTAVPTERATGNFINRTLGWNIQSGVQIPAAPSGNRIGPGFLPLSGGSQMEGNMDMGNNKITNLALPGTDGQAAANKNYVDGISNAFDQIEDLRNIEFNNVAADDLLVATGKKRIFTTPTSGGNWSVGNTISNAGATKTGTIVDVQSYVDDIEGNGLVVTYTPLTGTFAIGETLTNSGGGSVGSATIYDGPIDEIANAAEAANSVINWTVVRTAAGTTVDFQIENDTIINADVNSAAGISQSKLAMQSANTFDEDSAVSGWSGSQGKVQSDLGLAKFSDNNFETLSGYVRIRDNGLVFAELQDVNQYQVYGRQTAGSGDPEAVAYSDVIKYGAGLEDRDFNNAEWTYTAGLTKLVFANPVTVSNGNTLSQSGGTITGDVQGDVYLGTTVYLTNVSGTFATGNGDVQNDDAVPVANLGALTNASATNLLGKALIKVEDGNYATTTISTSGVGNTMARRDSNGKLDGAAIKVGGNDALTLSGSVLQVKTQGGAVMMEGSGAAPNLATTDAIQVKFPYAINVGAVTNNGTNDAFGLSEAQANSSWNHLGFVATNWTYTNFIEAAGESGGLGTATTGIGLGAGNGFTGAGDNKILLIAGGDPRITVSDTAVAISEPTTFADGVGVTAGGLTVTAGGITVNGGASVFNTNVDIGNDTSDTVTFTARVDSSFEPDATANNRNIGASARRWNTVYASIFNGTATTARYADLAEKYVADAQYEPGTVLVFGGDAEVTVTSTKGDHRVAGVVSTNPAYLMNSELDAVNTVEVALAGRVPCKVLGKVRKGDMLVASAIPGYAVVNNTPGVGTVIGKALESKDTDDRGVIEVVVGRA